MCILFTPSFLMCLAVKTALMQRSPLFCLQAFALNSGLQKSSQLNLVLLPELQEALQCKRRDFKNENRLPGEETIRMCQRNTLEWWKACKNQRIQWEIRLFHTVCSVPHPHPAVCGWFSLHTLLFFFFKKSSWLHVMHLRPQWFMQ